MKRVAFLKNATNPIYSKIFSAIEKAALQLDLTIYEFGVRDARDFVRAFETMQRQRMDALFVPGDAMFGHHRAQLIALADKAKLPAAYASRDYTEAGGLMSFSPSHADLFRRAASHVDKILRGANAGELPVEEALTFELVVNLKTAKALGLTIPQTVLLRADQVIE